MFEETQNLPTLSSFGSHLARKGLSRCWSKQYFEWSQEAEASLKKVKEEDGQMEMLMPELSLVKEEFRCIRGVSVLLKKAEMPDPWGRLWRGRNSEILANCRLSRFFWRENSRCSPVEEVRSASFTSKRNFLVDWYSYGIAPFPFRFARPSSLTKAGANLEGEGVNPSLANNDFLSLTLMWT